jgi:hypothetical protein
VLRPFWKRKGAALDRLCHEEEESRARQAGPARRPRPSGEGESEPVGEEGRWPRLGRKPELGQSSRNKILSNFNWNLDFWQTLKI